MGLRIRRELAITRDYHRDGASILGGIGAGGPPFVILGFDLQNELGALVNAGFTPMVALQPLTLDAVEFLGRTDEFGTVANGRDADRALLDDIHKTQKIRAVVIWGKMVGSRRGRCGACAHEEAAKPIV